MNVDRIDGRMAPLPDRERVLTWKRVSVAAWLLNFTGALVLAYRLSLALGEWYLG